MKKLLLVPIILILAAGFLILQGCGDDSDAEEQAETTAEITSTEADDGDISEYAADFEIPE